MTTIPSGTSVPDDWFVDFHSGPAARFWRAVGAAMADADAALVAGLLDLPPGAAVLDMPCGDGRIAHRLAARGLRVDGVDISSPEIEHARAAGGAAGFHVGDMRCPPVAGPYDGVVTWGNSFGYMPHADSLAALAATRGLLRGGGRLVLETATVAESLLVGGVSDEDVHEAGGVRMTIRSRYEPERSRLVGELVFEEGGRVTDRRVVAHHVHTCAELVRMLRDSGFGAVDLRGPDGRAGYSLGDPRLIAVANA
jgi:SAM-dependent methyltransferase